MPDADPKSPGPSRRVLWTLGLLVLALHWLVLGGVSPLELRLAPREVPAPVQLRVLTPPAPPAVAITPRPHAPRARGAVPGGDDPEASVSEPEASASMPSAPTPMLAQSPMPEPEASVSGVAPIVATSSAAATPETTSAWPLIPLGALPPSTLLSYQLTGMDKGFTYYASGELRWQHSDTAYELALTVRAFLIGSRYWRSVGRIEPSGLAPTRFSDSWRNERAAHFDREQQRVVFSSNSHPAVLQAGAQDQVSLYVQLAAAMAGEPERFVPGMRLQVQTVTVRDAQPWALALDKEETLTIDGRPVKTFKWVCQPRNQYEARVEFWVSAEQAWLPVRILITQASGSYIDLNWRGSEPLAPLGAS